MDAMCQWHRNLPYAEKVNGHFLGEIDECEGCGRHIAITTRRDNK
jgi:hypothetical protein